MPDRLTTWASLLIVRSRTPPLTIASPVGGVALTVTVFRLSGGRVSRTVYSPMVWSPNRNVPLP